MTDALKQAAQQVFHELGEAHDASLDGEHIEARSIILTQIEALRAALCAPQPAAPQEAEIRCAVMGFGCVAIGQTRDQVTGQAGIIYLDMGEQRDIDADTCDLFAPGSVPDPKKVLAHIQFTTADSVRQTIDELNALLAEHFGEHAAPQPAQAVPLTETEKVEEFSRPCYCSDDLYDWFDAGVRFAERAHGIKQPGSEAC